MSDPAPPPAELPAPQRAPRRAWRQLSVLLGLLALLLGVAAGLVVLLSETSAGRALVAQRLLPAVVLDNGLSVRAARIDGSLLGGFTLRETRLFDRAGLLATAPEVRVAWSPLALVGGGIRLQRLDIPVARLRRAPDLVPTPPDEPILPDIRLAVESFTIARLEVAEAVAGVAETLALSGRLDMRDQRLFIAAKARGARGDRLDLLLDSEPDSDRFDLGARLETAADGLVAALLGIDAPLDVRLSGEGGFARWRGALNARLGAAPLAELALALDQGTLAASGTVAPAPFLPAALRPAAGASVPVRLVARPEGEGATRLTAGARLASGRVGLSVRLDRRTEQLADGALVATLARPALLLAGLGGGPVSLSARFEGPLRAPTGSLRADAPSLSLAGLGETLTLGGPRLDARLDWTAPAAGRPVAPDIAFALAADRLAPMPAAFLGHAASPRLSGRIRLVDGAVRAEDVRLDAGGGRLVATLNAAQQADGRLQLAGTARLAALPVDGLGPVDAELSFAGGSNGAGLAARGEARVQLPRPAPGAALSLLGGAASARLPFAYARGVLTLAGGSLVAPGLRLAPVEARWALADGSFSLAARGSSTDYGPLRLEAEGTPARPRARLQLASPGLGLGLRDIDLQLVPAAGGVALSLSGRGSDGPVAGEALLLLAPGRPLAIEVARLAAGGLEARGRLEQTAAGPFDGVLQLSGPGLMGRLAFVDERGSQRIDLDAEAAQARLPLAVPVRIGAGSARLSLLFAPEGLRVTGTGEARNVRRETLELAQISGRGSMTGDTGEASLALSGRLGTRPLSLGLGLTFDQTGYRAGLKGQLAGVPLQLVGDARISRDGADWVLAPARLAIAGGTVDIAGRLGARDQLRIRLAGIDLSVIDSTFLVSQISGKLDGAIDWEDGGGAFPQARARLAIAGLAAEAGGNAMPTIDAIAEIASTATGLDAAIEMKGSRGSEGRMVVRLAPGPGETFARRALAGALSGGIRFFGRSETLWAFANVADQSLSGPLGLVADFSGTLGDPVLTGGLRGENLLYRHLGYGTRISGLTLQAQFAGNQVRLLSLAGDVQGGKLSGSGTVTLAAGGVDRVDLAFDLARARIADSPSTRIIVSGPLTLSGRLADAVLAGALVIDEGDIQLGRLQSAVVTSDIRVRRKDAPLPATAETAQSRISYDVRVSARDSVKVAGLGLDSFWGANVRIRGDLLSPRLTGEAVMARGTYDFAGRSFEITRGRVGFTGDPLDSQVDIQATAQSEGFRANVLISGTVRRPELAFNSIPPLPEDEVLARLLFGSSVADLSAPEALQLAAAVASLRGGAGGLDPLGRLQRASGLDRIRLTGSDAETGMGTGIAIGERLGRNIYVEVATDTEGNALTRVELTLTRLLSLLAHVNTLGDAGINLRYTRDY